MDTSSFLQRGKTHIIVAASDCSLLRDVITTALPQRAFLWLVDGGKCFTEGELFAEFASSLSFPSYFGSNWDALDECLSDLEWLDGDSHVFLIENAHRVAEQDRCFRLLIDILCSNAQAWEKDHLGNDPTMGFYKTVLHISEDERDTIHELLESAGVAYIDLTG